MTGLEVLEQRATTTQDACEAKQPGAQEHEAGRFRRGRTTAAACDHAAADGAIRAGDGDCRGRPDGAIAVQQVDFRDLVVAGFAVCSRIVEEVVGRIAIHGWNAEKGAYGSLTITVGRCAAHRVCRL